MNFKGEDHRMQFPTGHELIYGHVASGKTDTVRQRLTDEIAAEGAESWVVDPKMAVPEFAGLADKYAMSMDEVRRLMADLIAELHYRADKLAELGVTTFEVGDPRHNLPVVVVTVEEASTVLADPWARAVLERTVQEGRKVGVFTRLVVTSTDRLPLAAFGGSEVIRSSVLNGNVLECERATA